MKKITLSALLLMLFMSNAVLGQDLTVEQAKTLYEDYLYHGGESLSTEEIQKYLLVPRAKLLQKSRADLPSILKDVAAHPRYDAARKEKERQEVFNRIEQEQNLVSQLESNPLATIKKAETMLGSVPVSELQNNNAAEVAQLERDFVQVEWVVPVLCARDVSEIRKMIQNYADGWEDEDKPFSIGYGSNTQSLKKDKHNRYMALALIKKLNKQPQETINYLCQLASKAPKPPAATLKQANIQLYDGNFAKAEKMYKELQGNPATAAQASLELQKMRDSGWIQ